MKSRRIALFITLLGVAGAAHSAGIRSIPITFESNSGQTDPSVRFVGRAPDQTLFFRDGEIVSRFGDLVLRMQPLRSRPSVSVEGEDPGAGQSHYISGARPTIHARQFGRIRYRGLYRGIDLLVYGTGSTIEYDFVIAPGADPKDIRFQIRGNEWLRISPEGDLVLGRGMQEVRQKRPVAYQTIAGRRRSVWARFSVSGDEVGFVLGRWDRRYPLVVDPVVVYRSAFSGSQTYDAPYAITVDSSGNSYIAGKAWSIDFPTTGGTYLPSSGGGGVIKSADSGATFTQANSGMASSTACGSATFNAVTSIVVDPSTPTTLFAGIGDATQLVMKSTDAGLTWNPANGGIVAAFGNYAQGLGISPSSPSTLLLGTNSGFFRTTNGGTSWTKITNGPLQGNSVAPRIVFHPTNSLIVYANSTGSVPLQKSTDGGLTWAAVSSFPYSSAELLIDPSVPTTLYALAGPVYRSTDSGANWTATAGTGVNLAMAASSPSTLYTVRQAGQNSWSIWKSTNSSTSWSQTGTIPYAIAASSTNLVVDPQVSTTLYFYANQSSYQSYAIYKSTDSGATWTPLINGVPRIYQVTALAIHPQSSSIVYAGTGPYPDLSTIPDAFVTKLNASGSIVWSTYLGGRGQDEAHGVALDASGNVWVGGHTLSQDFPMTAGAVQPLFDGSEYFEHDLFVTKLNSAGSSILYSTYLGGSDDDQLSAMTADSTGAVYLTGDTSSTNYPEVSAAYSRPSPSSRDAFVTKLTAAGAIAYSTYLAGTNSDAGTGIALDSTNAVYVTGVTDRIISGTEFPNTTKIGTSTASWIFVTKLNATGGPLFSTLIGKAGSSDSPAIAVDSGGAAYLVASTSGELPTVNPAYSYKPSSPDAWIAKLNAAGTALVYATYLGGSGTDFGKVIVVNSSGEAIAAGSAAFNSTDFPLISSNSTTPGFWIAKVNASGSAFLYSSFMGEIATPRAAVLPAIGDVFVASQGGTTCTRAVITRVSEPATAPPAPSGLTATAVAAGRVDLTWTAVGSATSYQIDRRSAGGTFTQINTSGTNSFSDMTVTGGNAYLYRVRAVGTGGTSGNSNSDLATTVIFTDSSLSTLLVQAIHLSELRTAVQAVRALASSGAFSFTDSASAGVTIQALHVTQLRTALNEGLTDLGIALSDYADPSLSGVAVKAIHFQELRNRVQ